MMLSKRELEKTRKNLKKVLKELINTEDNVNIFLSISKEITYISRRDLGEIKTDRHAMILFIQDRITEIDLQLRSKD